MEISRAAATNIMHRFVEYNGVIYFGGVTADASGGTMYEQTGHITRKLDQLMAQAGTDKSRILSASIYISDFSSKGEMNRAWCEWLSASDLPTRATIGVGDLGQDILVEVVIVAAKET